MEILFLGTGAATANPLPFCRCDMCRAARKNGGKDFRRRSSVLIDGEILIDLGPDAATAAQAYGVNLSEVSCLLQTHAHSDHFDAGHFITRLADYATVDPKQITLIAEEVCMARMSDALAREESGATLMTSEWRAMLNVNVLEVTHGARVRHGAYEIIAVESAHDRAGGSVMYIVKKGDAAFFYACDTPLFTSAAWSLLESLDFKIGAAAVDQTYGPGTPGGGHMCADEVAVCAARLGCEKVYATHISHEGTPPHAVLERWTRARGYAVAYDGLNITI